LSRVRGDVRAHWAVGRARVMGEFSAKDQEVNKAIATALPNGRLPEARPMNPSDVETLRTRIRELETLCAEVYVAAVELGLPQPLLNRLWVVAAHGSTPHAFDIDLPPRLPVPESAAAPAPAVVEPIKKVEPLPIPDIRLTDRPKAPGDARTRAPQAELKALPERRTVMVVDDDQMMLEVIIRILQRENYELLTAASGAEALGKADAHAGTIDLLVTDYAMPEMKGRELAEKMRERYKDIKVLYQTGFSDMLFENRVELEEGSAFLEKPFTARGLREAARFSLFGAVNPESQPG
jgi:CheY-like chemotaxis protein